MLRACLARVAHARHVLHMSNELLNISVVSQETSPLSLKPFSRTLAQGGLGVQHVRSRRSIDSPALRGNGGVLKEATASTRGGVIKPRHMPSAFFASQIAPSLAEGVAVVASHIIMRDFAKRLWMWVKQGSRPMRWFGFDSGCKIEMSVILYFMVPSDLWPKASFARQLTVQHTLIWRRWSRGAVVQNDELQMKKTVQWLAQRSLKASEAICLDLLAVDNQVNLPDFRSSQRLPSGCAYADQAEDARLITSAMLENSFRDDILWASEFLLLLTHEPLRADISARSHAAGDTGARRGATGPAYRIFPSQPTHLPPVRRPPYRIPHREPAHVVPPREHTGAVQSQGCLCVRLSLCRGIEGFSGENNRGQKCSACRKRDKDNQHPHKLVAGGMKECMKMDMSGGMYNTIYKVNCLQQWMPSTHI
ncbi:hypothetical protein HOY80DRAFT_1133980 [Tuber brumale]|nr:hypothetical protein HOY80DRAFT_1133980 [Tuber brumale]